MRESGIPPEGIPNNYRGHCFDPGDEPPPPPPPPPHGRPPLWPFGAETDMAGWLKKQGQALIESDWLIVGLAVWLLCGEKESDDGLLLLLALLFLVR